MKHLYILLKVFVLVFFVNQVNSQTPEGDLLVKLHEVTTANMNSIVDPPTGSLVYNTDEQSLFVHTGTIWANTKTKIEAGDGVTISGLGTDSSPYRINTIKSTLTANSDGTYTFSNGIDSDVIITSSGGGNVPLVTSADSNGTCVSQFEANETKDVVIQGEYFDGDTRVNISGQTVNSVTVSSSTELTANVTAGNTPGDYDIQVITNGGTGTLTNGFSVKGAFVTHRYASGEITLSDLMSYNAGVLRRNLGSGWTQQGYSTVYGIPAGSEGSLSLTALTRRYTMIGLDNNPALNASYSTIDYAIYFISDGRVYIYENGSSRGSQSSFNPGDNFKIDVGCDGTVKYSKNGSVFYTSPVKATSTLYLDSSFYYSASEFSNLEITY